MHVLVINNLAAYTWTFLSDRQIGLSVALEDQRSFTKHANAVVTQLNFEASTYPILRSITLVSYNHLFSHKLTSTLLS